jgi:hypothetical protein
MVRPGRGHLRGLGATYRSTWSTRQFGSEKVNIVSQEITFNEEPYDYVPCQILRHSRCAFP